MQISLYNAASDGALLGYPTTLENVADLVVNARPTSGDADADLSLVTRGGRSGNLFVREAGGNFVVTSTTQSSGLEFFTTYSTAVQNDGRPVATFDGRLRLQAAGSGATDTRGGIWLDDEVPQRSYMGRGDNISNGTGVYADGAWRMAVNDDGLVTINTTAEAVIGADLTLRARPSAGDADTDLANAESRRQELLREHYVSVLNRALASGAAVEPDALLDLIASVNLSAAASDPAARRSIQLGLSELFMVRNDYDRAIALLEPMAAERAELSASEQVAYAETLAASYLRTGKSDLVDVVLRDGETAAAL